MNRFVGFVGFVVLSLLAIGMQIPPQVHAQVQSPSQTPKADVQASIEAGKGPYSATADAGADVRQALEQARKNHKAVLVFFGANWCEDCRSLARALELPRNATLMAQDFNVVKVDVGNFDRNLDVVDQLGGPIARGIPAAVLLSPGGDIRYSTKAGELSTARRMSAEGVYEFFEHLLVDAEG